MIFMPPVGHRGNVARSLFYFSVRYDIAINKNEEQILRQWHKMDPIDANEKARHEIVAKYQKVRNPFVDYPQLVEKVADF
jgi:deoxyribonuclease-1